MKRLAELLEERRDGPLPAAEAAELDRLLADPVQAAAAVAAERDALALHGLLGGRDPQVVLAELHAHRHPDHHSARRALAALRRHRRRQGPGRPWLPWLAAAAVVLGVGTWLAWPRTAPGLLVAERTAPSDSRLPPLGEQLPVGSRIDLGSGERLLLRAADGSHIVLEGDSVLAIEGLAPVLALHLDRGRAALTVAAQAPGRGLRVQTPHAEVAVVGTRFTVSVDETATDVAVDAGVVEVADAGGRHRIGAAGRHRSPAASVVVDPRWGAQGLNGLIAADDGWLRPQPPRLLGPSDEEAVWTSDAHGGSLRTGTLALTLRQQPVAGGLRLDLEAHSPSAVSDLRLRLLTLAGPPPAGGWPSVEIPASGSFAWLATRARLGRYASVSSADGGSWRVALVPDGAVCHVEVALQNLPAERPQRLRTFVGAATEGEPPIVATAQAGFLQRHPLVQRWDGIARLAMLAYAGGAAPTEANPNCWFGGQIDVRTSDGRARFRELVLAEADAALAAFQALRLDGVYIWGLEGSRHLNEAGFIGDPTRLAELAPEMDAVADELCARFHDAGLRVGLVVRPWRLDRSRSPARFVIDPATAEAELAARVAYARERWGIRLCHLMFAHNHGHGPAGVPPAVVRRLAERFPDVVFTSDLDRIAWRAVAGGWQDLSQRRDTQEVPLWRRLYPAGRDLLYVDDDWRDEAVQRRLRAALSEGAVPLLRWHPGLAATELGEVLDAAARP